MKSKTKKRIAAAVAGVSTLAGLAYVISREDPQPQLGFRGDTQFFTEGMDLAVPVYTKKKTGALPATKSMFATPRFESQYKPKGRMVPLLQPSDPKWFGNRSWAGYNKVLAAPVVATRTNIQGGTLKTANLRLAGKGVKRMIRTGDWGLNDVLRTGLPTRGWKTRRNFVKENK